MFATLIVLSLAGVKNETPIRNVNKLECLNPVRVKPKQDTITDTSTDKCLAVPDTSKPSRKVPK